MAHGRGIDRLIKRPSDTTDKERIRRDETPYGGTPRTVDDKGNVFARDISPNTPTAQEWQRVVDSVMDRE